MEHEALDTIIKLTEERTTAKVHNEVPYYPVEMKPCVPSLAARLSVCTLTSVVNYFTGMSKEEQKEVCAHVETPTKVHLIRKTIDTLNRRDCLVSADAVDIVSRFKFGQHHNQEDFLIELQGAFHPTDQLSKLIDVVSSVSVSDESDLEDDGITQVATSKAGVAMKAKIKIPNPIKLQPYRTFPEVPAESESLVFRVSKGQSRHSDGPTFALYQSGSGRWQLNAVLGIKKYLKAAGLSVI